MSHPFLINGQKWASALRTLIGYPSYSPTRHTVAFSFAGPRSPAKDRHVTQIAAETQRDMINLNFHSIDEREPSHIGMAVLRAEGVEWLSGVRLYAANRSSPIELIHRDKRWRIDERNQLVSRKLPPRRLLTRGEQIAWRRLRRTVDAMQDELLDGGTFVREGQPYADRVQMNDLQIAA